MDKQNQEPYIDLNLIFDQFAVNLMSEKNDFISRNDIVITRNPY